VSQPELEGNRIVLNATKQAPAPQAIKKHLDKRHALRYLLLGQVVQVLGERPGGAATPATTLLLEAGALAPLLSVRRAELRGVEFRNSRARAPPFVAPPSSTSGAWGGFGVLLYIGFWGRGDGLWSLRYLQRQNTILS
jgi:hypothetical protein